MVIHGYVACGWNPPAVRFKPVQTGSDWNRLYPVWVWQTQVLTWGGVGPKPYLVTKEMVICGNVACGWNPQAVRFKPVQTGSDWNRLYPVWVWQTQVLTCGEVEPKPYLATEEMVIRGNVACGWNPQAVRIKPVQTGSDWNRLYPVWVWQTQVLTCGEVGPEPKIAAVEMVIHGYVACGWNPQAVGFKPVQTGSDWNWLYPVWVWHLKISFSKSGGLSRSNHLNSSH